MSLKSRGRDESLIICEMKQYISTYYRSFLHWLALLSLSETSNPHHGVPHGHSLHLRHGLTYRSEKNFVWFICTDHVLAPKIFSHGSAWCADIVHCIRLGPLLDEISLQSLMFSILHLINFSVWWSKHEIIMEKFLMDLSTFEFFFIFISIILTTRYFSFNHDSWENKI